jgi:hypothetical protein
VHGHAWIDPGSRNGDLRMQVQSAADGSGTAPLAAGTQLHGLQGLGLDGLAWSPGNRWSNHQIETLVGRCACPRLHHLANLSQRIDDRSTSRIRYKVGERLERTRTVGIVGQG